MNCTIGLGKTKQFYYIQLQYGFREGEIRYNIPMILLKFLVLVFTLYIYVSKVLEFLYRYQLKEYRWDRMKSYIKETGWWQLFYGMRLVFPGKRARNMAIFAFLFLEAIGYIWFSYRFPEWLLTIQLLLTPVIAFIDVSFLVWVTNIPVGWYREGIIRKAQKKLSASNAKVIMVTGSYGKTSVKEYLFDVLQEEFAVAKTDENMNTDIGVAQCILKNLKQNTQYFIAEVGAYRVGEIAKICSFAPPDYVVVTAFGNQHLDLYGSKENLVKAESEPLEFLQKEGIAFINGDIPEYDSLVKKRDFTIRTYSVGKRSDIYATDIRVSDKGTAAKIHRHTTPFTISTTMLGSHTIQNLLPVVDLAFILGMSQPKIVRAIHELEPVKNKLSLHSGPKKTTVLSDAGNSNVNGCIEAIKILNHFPQEEKIVISKGIIELGKEKKQSYERILSELKKTSIQLYTTDKLFEEIDSTKTVYVADEGELLEALAKSYSPDTVILIEGRFSANFLKQLL